LQTDIPLEINEDKSLKKEILKFSPSISGKTYLVDQSTVEFRPDEKLKQGKIYTATMDLKPIYASIPKELENFQFQFQAKKQDFSVKITGLQDTEDGQGTYNFIGDLHTSDVANSSKI